MKKHDEGFTLIELLIVIVILGILAAVVVFAVGGITDTGDASACKTERRTVETAIEAYRAQEGTYPTAMSALTGGAFLRDDPTYWSLNGTGGDITTKTAKPSGC
jgi:type II secretion system protein G